MRKTVRKRKPTLLMYAIAFFVLCSTMYMITAIYLKQYNNQLSVQIQQTERSINTLSHEKEALQVEIDKLATKAKVVDAIDSEDMSHNKDNIVYINGNED